MDNFGGFGLGKAFRKKRTNLYRRPQNESQLLVDCGDISSISATPPSSHDNVDYGNISRTSNNNLSEAETAVRPGFEDGTSGNAGSGDIVEKDSQIDENRSNEGDLTTSLTDPQKSGTGMCSNHSGLSGVVSDDAGNDKRLKKFKLKVGGVTRTIHTSSVAGSSSTKSSSSSDASCQPKENTGGNHSSYTGKAIGLRGIPWKDFAKTGLRIGRMDSSQGQLSRQIAPLKQFGKYGAAHKSKPVLRRHLSGETFDDEDEEEDDDEIRYLEKLRSSKYAAGYSAGFEDDDELGSKRHRKISRVLSQTSSGYGADLGDCNSRKAGNGIKKFKLARGYQDTLYEEEAELSDTELEPKNKKQRKEFIDTSADGMIKMAVTTRQRALQTGKYISSNAGLSHIEFPHGLPPPPPKKQKEKLTEVELQVKKAEAAQRRRMQAEKAARESEAEAIRKILGQDSSRKKREDKLKKRQEELAQERTATATAPPSNAIRWVMGPSGTVVTFPNDMGLPSIFESKPCSYPPPREKCAGPSCMNTYKYRDSKSKLPLCSLQCYKAIHEKIQPLSAC